MKNTILFLLVLSFLFVFTACKKDKEGCTNPASENYNPDADVDDGSCIIKGCSDPLATNFNPDATTDDGNCLTFVGKWEVRKLDIGGDDLVDLGYFKDVEFEFESNGDMSWEYEYYSSSAGTYFPRRSEGTWELDLSDKELKIEWDASSDNYICDEYDEEFNFDFDGTDDIELSTNNCDGETLVMDLER